MKVTGGWLKEFSPPPALNVKELPEDGGAGLALNPKTEPDFELLVLLVDAPNRLLDGGSDDGSGKRRSGNSGQKMGASCCASDAESRGITVGNSGQKIDGKC